MGLTKLEAEVRLGAQRKSWLYRIDGAASQEVSGCRCLSSPLKSDLSTGSCTDHDHKPSRGSGLRFDPAGPYRPPSSVMYSNNSHPGVVDDKSKMHELITDWETSALVPSLLSRI